MEAGSQRLARPIARAGDVRLQTYVRVGLRGGGDRAGVAGGRLGHGCRTQTSVAAEPRGHACCTQTSPIRFRWPLTWPWRRRPG